jgi:hypothetical protein
MSLLRRNLKSTIMFVAGLILGAALVLPALAINQPQMTTGRNLLVQARTHILGAVADKGGHRDAAVNLINQAISQVNQGIVYCNQHC